MADQKLVDILKQGSQVWNKWREEHSEVLTPDLREADFHEADLSGANLRGSYFYRTNFSGANLRGVNLHEANFHETNFEGADLSGANLKSTLFANTRIEGAILTGCKIYGLAVWGLKGKPREQSNLIITPSREAVITVDNIQVAQFIYLMLSNIEIRNVIDTITSKAVLILGRFTGERKGVLDAIKEALRQKNYLPILFDFEGPQSRNLTETVSTLAHMAKFVIADITDAKSIPQELMAIVPHLPSLPIQPLRLASETEFSMFEDYRPYPWMLKTCHYNDVNSLIASLQEKVIQPAETWLANNR
ncbi:pentapeptide repeat-containing protein [Spirosoma validum]|uniref:Pentapeptide repeat-containing protein n=1 Tax=Spirosoma validum TaxID=2771355 RepID=A0A927B3R3_9BACT|nr:pentapeptide repeat-containing protein [Spirosoma validum]MBD2755075.1 pentapeptide repeat-containing protein [Spirosoma validum]